MTTDRKVSRAQQLRSAVMQKQAEPFGGKSRTEGGRELFPPDYSECETGLTGARVRNVHGHTTTHATQQARESLAMPLRRLASLLRRSGRSMEEAP